MVRIMNECDCGKIISSNKSKCKECNEIIEEYYSELEAGEE